MNLTTEFIDNLTSWQSSGRRSITIDIKPESMCLLRDEPISIWAYDYDLVFGRSIKTLSDLPTTKEMKEEKRKEAKRQIEQLEKQL